MKTNNSGVTFSVIIPHYSAPRELGYAVESALGQSYAAAEIIVVDDCSPEGQGPQLGGIQDDRLRILTSEQNAGGPAAPRNQGVDASTGEYVAFLDADDCWSREHLQVLAEAIERTGADVVGSTIRDFGNPGDLPTLMASDDLWQVNVAAVMRKNPFATSATAVRARLAKITRFDESPELRAVEDGHLWQRLVIGGAKAIKLRHETVYYFNNPNGISRDKLKHLVKVFRALFLNDRLIAPDRSRFMRVVVSSYRLGFHCLKSVYLRVFQSRL